MGYEIKEVKDALAIHCKRRARHLCKLYAEAHGKTEDDRKQIYSELIVYYGLVGLDAK